MALSDVSDQEENPDGPQPQNGQLPPQGPPTSGGPTPVSSAAPVSSSTTTTTTSSSGMRRAGGRLTNVVDSTRILAPRCEKPPDFLKDRANLHIYKDNLKRWDRCTTLDPKLRGDYILMNIPEGNIMRETMIRQVGKKVVGAENGVDIIIKALESIYGTNQVLESYLRFIDLDVYERPVGMDILEYVSSWENLYDKALEKGVTLEDRVCAFKLLMSCNIPDVDLKLVMADLDIGKQELPTNLYNQVVDALRKFKTSGQLSAHSHRKHKTYFGSAGESQPDTTPENEDTYAAKTGGKLALPASVMTDEEKGKKKKPLPQNGPREI